MATRINKELIDKVLELSRKGYTEDEIAIRLAIPLSTVQNIIFKEYY